MNNDSISNVEKERYHKGCVTEPLERKARSEDDYCFVYPLFAEAAAAATVQKHRGSFRRKICWPGRNYFEEEVLLLTNRKLEICSNKI